MTPEAITYGAESKEAKPTDDRGVHAIQLAQLSTLHSTQRRRARPCGSLVQICGHPGTTGGSDSASSNRGGNAFGIETGGRCAAEANAAYRIPAWVPTAAAQHR